MATQEPKHRISKGTGRLMVFVGLLFDMLPLLLIIVVMAFIFSGLNNSVTEAACDDNAITRFLNTPVWDWGEKGDVMTVCEGATLASAGVAFIGGGIIMGPALYAIGSIISVFLAFVVFLMWFGSKGVFVLSLSSGRIMINMFTFVVESVPVLNIIPTITFATWRHVHITQKKDEKRVRAYKTNLQAQQKLANRQQARRIEAELAM